MRSKLGPGRGVECPTPREFVSSIVNAYPRISQLCSFSTAVYDSAWLSMIYKYTGDSPANLFPECFEFVLKEQANDGGWKCYGSRFDGLLNSLASLLALVTYRRTCGTTFRSIGLEPRIQSATSHVRQLLHEWDIDATVQVGFELLITGLLKQLQSFAVEFSFPALPQLETLYQWKLQRFAPKLVYSETQTTILHSLEALVGVIDFDRVKHHCCEETGLLASPAATAAYLIHSTEWDGRAERYLRTVLETYDVDGKGGVPSAFPTPVFEITWMLSSMLSSVVEVEDLDPESLSTIASFLHESIQLKSGTVGVAPGLLSDADDTARALMTLQLLGHKPSYAPMIEQFEAKDHFRTYEFERNPSFSANCNVLLALLQLDDVDQYVAQVLKALNFVLHRFEQNDISDKWNISSQYCAMLLAQAFVKLLGVHESGQLRSLNETVLKERIPIAICRILICTLATQGEDGDWNGSLEETSYSVLVINQCLCLRWNRPTEAKIQESLRRGRDYIRRRYPSGEQSHYLWVEKTTYEPALLKAAYCSMAFHLPGAQRQCSTEMFCISELHTKKMTNLLSTLPNFTGNDLAFVEPILVEAKQLSSFLRQHRQDIFPRDQIPMSEDKYLEFIPVIWTMCNSKAKQVLPAEVVRDMVQLSLLNYQIDEYMETVVGTLGNAQVKQLVEALRKDFQERHDNMGHDSDTAGEESPRHSAHQAKKRRKLRDGKYAELSTTNGTTDLGSSPVERVLQVLRRYIAHILTHEAVLAVPSDIRITLAKELYSFLFAHITHNADNVNAQTYQHDNESIGYACPDIERSSYFKWVNTTGADNTSCPFSFQFFACLISRVLLRSEGRHTKDSSTWYCFESAHVRYVAETVARRLAAMCRMYNDYGSAARDKKEANLNSLEFKDFHTDVAGNSKVGHNAEPTDGDRVNEHCHSDSTSPRRGDDARGKEELMFIAEFEREGLEQAMSKLRQIVPSKAVVDMVDVFANVTDTFGLLYVRKDIASTKVQK